MDEDYIFVIGDGDKVRERVEALLLSAELPSLKSLSAAITASIAELGDRAAAEMAADVIIAGGDDLLLRVPAKSFSRVVLEGLATSFRDRTGCTLSFGVGPDIDSAYLNLRRAKARGGAAIVVERQV